MHPSAEVEGDGRVVKIHLEDRIVRAGVFPVSIDFQEFAGAAATDPVSERVAGLRSEFLGRTVILGVDRLDYSKGIPHKLAASASRSSATRSCASGSRSSSSSCRAARTSPSTTA
jgi:trehalose-6-phosphate synthase